jgi:fibrillarin-like pre-rRNA processing protein
MLKTRSVDIRKEPEEVFENTIDSLTSAGLIVRDSKWLAPFHGDHAGIVCIKP